MRACSFVAAALVISVATAVPVFKRADGFDFAHDEVRGVNIGGWLVLEP